MQLFANANYNIIPKRKIGYMFSGILILISIVSLIIHGGPKYNIDFTGGTLIQLKFEKDIQIDVLRKALSAKGYNGLEIKHFGSSNEVAIRAGLQRSAEEISGTMETIISKAIPDNPFVVQQIEKVGPKIGQELVWSAVKAIFWALVLILFYILWRFEFRFSIGAIVALIHDVTITLGVFSIFEIEISAPLIAAILTIVGYSLNDTIVVFDRIRENMKSSKKNRDIGEIANVSINETLSRTVITSVTTLIVVLVLFIFGGEVLHSFALALIIGIVIGTYSSVFIASPIVVDWKVKKA
jgi:preprotein translocase subunit SecF